LTLYMLEKLPVRRENGADEALHREIAPGSAQMDELSGLRVALPPPAPTLILACLTPPCQPPAPRPDPKKRRNRRPSPHSDRQAILRANAETPLAARPGDIIFSADELKAESVQPVSLLPPKTPNHRKAATSSSTPNSQGSAPGKITLPHRQLLLPPSTGPHQVAQPAALRRHDARSRKARGDILPLTALAANVRTQIQPFEDALKADPNNTAALVNEAAIYDGNNSKPTPSPRIASLRAVEKRSLGSRRNLRTRRIPRHARPPQSRRDFARRQNLRSPDRHLEISKTPAGPLAANTPTPTAKNLQRSLVQPARRPASPRTDGRS